MAVTFVNNSKEEKSVIHRSRRYTVKAGESFPVTEDNPELVAAFAEVLDKEEAKPVKKEEPKKEIKAQEVKKEEVKEEPKEEPKKEEVKQEEKTQKK